MRSDVETARNAFFDAIQVFVHRAPLRANSSWPRPSTDNACVRAQTVRQHDDAFLLAPFIHGFDLARVPSSLFLPPPLPIISYLLHFPYSFHLSPPLS